MNHLEYYMEPQKRASGSTVQLCMLKTGEGVYQQAEYMRENADVFLAPLAMGAGYAVFPVATPYSPRWDMYGIWTTLEKLWGPEQEVAERRELMDYLYYCSDHARKMGDELCRLWVNAWREEFLVMGTKVKRIHGDLTLDHVMHTREGVRLIDPNLRPVPRIKEMDQAKMLVSVYGWNHEWMELRGEVEHRLGIGPPPNVAGTWEQRQSKEAKFLRWLALSHIVRMWRYYPGRHLLLGTMMWKIAGGV